MMSDNHPRVLLTGATGFIGGRLLHALKERGITVRCLVRSAKKFQRGVIGGDFVEVVEGDLLQPGTLSRAMDGMDAAYYLVHSMGGGRGDSSHAFAQKDRMAALNFREAAEHAGVQRIIYLGGLGEESDSLSEHLASRLEVARILQSGKIPSTVLRAAVIIGSGGASFEMLRYLVERLPLMICPRWILTRSQPIAVANVIDYLLGCLLEPRTAGLRLDIGGPQILSYKDLMETYAKVRGLRRFMVTVPVLTPRLSAYWINLVTPVPAGLVLPLVEGLRNEVICRDNRIRDLVPIRLIPMEEAICTALAEARRGPGALPSRQACFYGTS